ncbi:MAG: CHAT domain-containing protein [Flammeovirgaceae bacterium]|nr:MAG: CHAT domain-containing protein [Flammeovirgaceae bacterium]
MARSSLLPGLLLFVVNLLQAQNSQSASEQIDELLYDSKFEDAIAFADKFTGGTSEISILIGNKKAEALIQLGRYEQATALLDQLQSQAEKSNKPDALGAIVQSTRGFLYLNQGRSDLALELLENAVITLNETGDPLYQARAMAYLGQAYSATGKYAQAEEQLQMALTIRLDKLPESHELIAASYNDLGMAFSQTDVDKALDYFDKAIELYTRLHGATHPKTAIVNTNMGLAYRSLKLYGDAITVFEDALKIWQTVYVNPHPSQAFVLLNLGQTYASMGELNTALSFYAKALAIYQQTHGRKHPDIASTYNLIGKIKVTQGNFNEGLASYQQALIANVSTFESTDVNQNPDGSTFYNGNQLLYSIMYKAQALEGRYFGKTLKQTDLNNAITHLQNCDALIDRLRQQTIKESDKITLGAIANEVYADGARIAFELSDVAFRKRSYYRELSFYFAEKSKAAVLLDAISDTNAKSFAGIPEELLEEERGLKSALALVNQKLAQKPSEDEEKYLRETAFHLNQSYQAFIKNLENQYPEYFNLKYNSTAPSISQVQAVLPGNSAVLSYFIDDYNGRARLYTYVITKKSFRIVSKPLPAAYNKNLTGYRNSIFFRDQHSFIETATALHRTLIPGLPRHINDLIILPAGRMGVIPFEALLTQKVKNEDEPYPVLPYLVKKFSTRYEFSTGLMLQRKSDKPGPIQSAMLCAPVTFPEKDNLSDLPGTAAEVNTLNELFATKKISCELLTNHLASESAIKTKALKNYNLLHFATHGIVDENNPELSRIFLQNDSEAEDGNLFSGEIYNLQLNASLVTLSACQTGLGKISKGEGVIGLSRALVYAGAKNIIVTFWSVSDESTAQLMTDFYKLLLENPSLPFSSTLRQAKLNLLSSHYSAPYYWAPFVLIGF